MAVLHKTIAVVFDCDDTLSADTTSWLIEECGGDPKELFGEAAQMISRGWDPPLAYLNLIMRESKSGGSLESFSKDSVSKLSAECSGLFFPGTEDLFQRLKDSVANQGQFKEVGIEVNCYIISGGIEEFLSQTSVGKLADAVWASSFEYDDVGKPVMIKNCMSFTEKTRYLFCINKGLPPLIARTQPYYVNSVISDQDRPVPFRNMIYVGDGPSDIPAMSLVMHNGGKAIGILGEKTNKAWELGFGRRTNITIPPDYRDSQTGFEHLKRAVITIAEDIRQRWDIEYKSVPKY